MEVLDKQVADTHRTAGHSGASDIIAAIARDADMTESNYAAMIERVRLCGQASRPCGACRGRGHRAVSKQVLEEYARRISKSLSPTKRHRIRLELNAKSQCDACHGTGTRSSESRATMCDFCNATGRTGHGRPCKACRGQGVLFLGDFDDFATTAKCARCGGTSEVLDEDEQDVCPVCKGASYTIPTTVKEKGSSKKGRVPRGMDSPERRPVGGASGKVIGEDDSEATMAVLRMRETNPRALEALRLYHGPVGDRWGVTRWGRLFAVWPMTEAGRRVLAEAAERTSKAFLRDPHDFLSKLREAEALSESPNLPLRAQFGQADREARALVRDAGQVAGGAR